MASAAAGRVALMAIHPGYAEAILSGSKTVEFRKRPLADDVTSVLIYATSPIRMIVGEFSVERIVEGRPFEVWNSFGDVGCIDSDSFNRYYKNSEKAYAILIKEIRRLDYALPLSALEPQPTVPQSFMYLSREIVSSIWGEACGTQLDLFAAPDDLVDA